MKQRISAGALVFSGQKILLVRHRHEEKYDFLVAPGGGVRDDESAAAAAAREAWEETRAVVEPIKLAYVEELYGAELRICKLWFLCRLLDATVSVDTDEARREHIVEAGFYARESLVGKKVFPAILQEDRFWDGFEIEAANAAYLGMSKMAIE